MIIIFLDIDGVLNNASWIHKVTADRKTSHKEYKSFLDRDEEEIDPERVKLLNSFAEAIQASIVVSSSWRKLFTFEELVTLLQRVGFTAPIIGVTPNSPDGFRGSEVVMWLEEHATNVNCTKCVIFDDDSDFYPHQPLVKTTWEEGLLPSHITQAVKLLNRRD